MNDNTGHGHVWQRPDGVKARCGGPGVCAACSADQAALIACHSALLAADQARKSQPCTCPATPPSAASETAEMGA